jgi:large subunit ribosomal protein L9
MQVILLQDVDKVGLRGEVVEVARGYARNYLLPRQLAQAATRGALEDLRRRDEVRARQEARTHEEARDIAARLEQTVLRFDVKAGPTGSLFGSVTATDISDRLWADHKIRIDRRKVDRDPIKRVGRYEVPLEVFTDVDATLRLEVVPEGGDVAEMEAMEAAARAEEEAAAAAEAEAAAAEPEGAVETEDWVEELDEEEAAPEPEEAAGERAETGASEPAEAEAEAEPEPEPEPAEQ